MPITINGSTGIAGIDGSAGTPALQGSDTNTGIAFGADVILASTGGTERWRVDSSGRLLVGTSSGRNNAKMVIEGYTGGTGTGALDIRYAGTNPASGSEIGTIRFTDQNTSDTAGPPGVYAQIIAAVDGTASGVGTDVPGRLVFSTTADGASSPTERMRLDNTGQLNVYASASVILSRSQSTAGTANALYYGLYSASSTTGSGTISYVVYTNGNVQNSNNSYGQYTSDERFKQDIIDAPSQWDDIKAVRLKKYRWKSEPNGEMLLGPIAQELQSVCPGLIQTRIADGQDVELSDGAVQEGDEILGWKSSVLYLKAVKALQEAMERIETLEAKVAALEVTP